MANQNTAQHAQKITLRTGLYAGIACLLDNHQALASMEQLSTDDLGYLHGCCEAANSSLSSLLETAALLVDEKLNPESGALLTEIEAARFLAELSATISGLNRLAFELSNELSYHWEQAEKAQPPEAVAAYNRANPQPIPTP